MNRPDVADKFEVLASMLDLPPSSSGFDATMAWVLELRSQLDIPHTLNEIGVVEASAAELAAKAEQNPTGWTNPRRLSEAEYKQIYVDAFHGRL